MLSKRLTIGALALPLLAAALCGSLRAAELGEIKVNSHIGQQLSADIELVDLTAADLGDLQARLANPDVFKGANVGMPPVLNGLYISIARRDNKRFLHLTTLQPVNADALHLFVELSSGGRQIIRSASLWLTPEPPDQRAANVTAAPVAEPVPLAPLAKPPVSGNGEAALSEAAQRAFEHRRQVALAKAQEQSANPAPQTATAAVPKVEPARETVVTPPTRKPAARPSPAPAAPAPSESCAPAKEVEAQLRQCEAMTTKLTDIEGKVRRLQNAVVAPAAAAIATASAPAAAAKAEAHPAKPSSTPVKPGATPVKPGVAADLATNPRSRLFMILGGVLAGLAALGGLIYFLRKRQAKGPLKIWQSFRRKGSAEDDVPTLEDAVEVAAQ